MLMPKLPSPKQKKKTSCPEMEKKETEEVQKTRRKQSDIGKKS